MTAVSGGLGIGGQRQVRGANETRPEKNLGCGGYAHYPDCGDPST